MKPILKTDFLKIIEKAAEIIECKNLADLDKGEDFEELVLNIFKQISPYPVEHTGKQTFPDIIIGGYGVEVKFSKSNKWESIGNSIFEGTFDNRVTEEIYVFFGRKINNNQVKVKFNLYENCLADVKVTHSPRFYINMDTQVSILNEIGFSYKMYRELPVHAKGNQIKKYLKSKLKPGDKVWWIDEGEERSLIIRKWGNLTDNEKSSLWVELICLFPEMVSKSSLKYERAKFHCFNIRQVEFSRDHFSASGQVSLLINKTYIPGIPAIFGRLFEHAQGIYDFLQNISIEKLVASWEDWQNDSPIITPNEVEADQLKAWLKIIDALSIPLPEGLTPSIIFNEGLKRGSKL